MDKQHKAFISYSRANKDFVLRLAKELRAKGYPVWLDLLDIALGERWDREVERALKECEIFIVILAPDTINSENVLDEIGYAIDHHKHFMPILIETCEIPYRLKRFQYLDFTDKSFEDGLAAAEDFLEKLHDTLPPHRHIARDTEAGQSVSANVKENLVETEEFNQKEAQTIHVSPPGSLPETARSKPKASQPVESYQRPSSASPAKFSHSSVSIAGRKKASNLGSLRLIGMVFLVMVCIIAGLVLGRIAQMGLLTSQSPSTIATNMLMPENTSINHVPGTNMSSGTTSPLYVSIKSITVDTSGRYVVDFEIFGYNPEVPGTHMHFFFNTVPVDQAGEPGKGPWILYSEPSPFTMYREIDRPENATAMCVLVANHDHTVVPGSGNCKNLP